MGGKWIEKSSSSCCELVYKIKDRFAWEGQADAVRLFLIIQGTPSSKTGHSDFYFFLVPKANNAYTSPFQQDRGKWVTEA